MSPITLEVSRAETSTIPISPAAAELASEAQFFYDMNEDLFLSDSVMLQQLYVSKRSELRNPQTDHVGESDKSKEIASMYSIAMHMQDRANPAFTVIEAVPGSGRDVVAVGLHEGLVARYDAQGVMRGVHQLDEDAHQEYLLALKNYMGDKLLTDQVHHLNAERLKNEIRLGSFLLNPVIDVDDCQGGTQKVRLSGKKFDDIVEEIQGRIDRIGFRKWPPVSVSATQSTRR